MSIMSAFRQDDSSAMYKRFAYLVATYVDQPEVAVTPVAQIPLENIFRLLEMYRYDAFKDENRSGVLASRSFSGKSMPRQSKAWHINIQQALTQSLNNVFGNVPSNQAIDELENVLRGLANDQPVSKQQQTHAKDFFNNFHQVLV